jgi:hypothetical protein
MLKERTRRPDLRGYWWASEPPLMRAELADQALHTLIASAHNAEMSAFGLLGVVLGTPFRAQRPIEFSKEIARSAAWEGA